MLNISGLAFSLPKRGGYDNLQVGDLVKIYHALQYVLHCTACHLLGSTVRYDRDSRLQLGLRAVAQPVRLFYQR